MFAFLNFGILAFAFAFGGVCSVTKREGSSSSLSLISTSLCISLDVVEM